MLLENQFQFNEGWRLRSAINEKVPEWLAEFNEVTDNRVLWDLIKYRVRQFTIKYTKDKAKKRTQKLVEIETSIEEAEEALKMNSSTVKP